MLAGLERLAVEEPNAELIVLSEYTFSGAIPQDVKEWCRTKRRYLIVGGRDEAENDQFYNTAFVIGPEGEVVFKQAKSVPIQFMQDGLPAEQQRVWDSPWGKLGIGICYDLSYREVMDQYVEQGAEALIIPTMDVQDWGQEQHDLHARVAPMRSMEYGLPIVRLASSGVSQLTTPEGVVEAEAPFPGQHRILSGRLKLSGAGVIPVDRFLAPFSCLLTLAFVLFFITEPVFRRMLAGFAMRHESRFASQLAPAMAAGYSRTVCPVLTPSE